MSFGTSIPLPACPTGPPAPSALPTPHPARVRLSACHDVHTLLKVNFGGVGPTTGGAGIMIAFCSFWPLGGRGWESSVGGQDGGGGSSRELEAHVLGLGGGGGETTRNLGGTWVVGILFSTNSPLTLTGAPVCDSYQKGPLFRVGVASESHWLRPMRVLAVHWWPAPVSVGGL